MALRCGCYDQADDLVFGPLHTCSEAKDPCTCGFPFGARTCPLHGEPDLHRFVPSSAFVVPGLLDPAESVHASNIQAELDRLEPLYRHVLSDEQGDLG